MFSKEVPGGFVVLCSGRPHYSKERRKVTHVDKNTKSLTVAAELFDLETGLVKGVHKFGKVSGCRRVYLAEGEMLKAAIRGEITKKLLNLHVKDLKNVSDESILEASTLLGVTLQTG